MTDIVVETVGSPREAEQRRQFWANTVCRLKLQDYWGVSVRPKRIPDTRRGRHRRAFDILVGLHNPDADAPAIEAALAVKMVRASLDSRRLA